MYQRHTIIVITAADGTGSAYTECLTGRVVSIQYVKPGSGGYSDGSIMTVTAETTGRTVWTQTGLNASAVRVPQTAVGAETAEFAVIDERLLIAITGGGDTKTGTFQITIKS